jgi:ABC-type nickel/cobalt efflux system permease component RcnA
VCGFAPLRLGVKLVSFAIFLCSATISLAHPLGNFTVNHFSRIQVSRDQIRLRYVIDMAEIPTFQELQSLTGTTEGAPTSEELDRYASGLVASYADRLLLSVDGVREQLELISKKIQLLPGAGGMPTMRVECEFTVPTALTPNATRHLRFEDQNYPERIGWREIVVSSSSGVSVFDSSAYGSAITDELKAYPVNLTAPPDERQAQFSITAGIIPNGSRPLMARDGQPVTVAQRDRLAELIAVPKLTARVALVGLLIAILLGGLHAMSPGHGKAVVGAYLIGSRGTARHAAFLGLTVTVTHTAGVFALGMVTLLASNYVVPERLYPILSLLSGAIVVFIGVSLLVRRFRSLLVQHSAAELHADDGHTHAHGESMLPHSHGGRSHSHVPPGDGSPVTWKSLLLLGISGGLLPCPSALVVLLAAISLHRVGYGLLLVVAFSIGLAAMLTAVGLVFVYARRLVKLQGRFGSLGRVQQVLPVVSALVISCAGLVICYGALEQAGLSLSVFLANAASEARSSLGSAGALGLLGLGLLYGLKHATEVDHIVAVSAIVTEHRKLTRAALVGGLWGAGHTASLVIVGTAVLALKIAIPNAIANWLEFGVALMIIGLGLAAIRRAFYNRADLHLHTHAHGDLLHAHVHFHDPGATEGRSADFHSHAIAKVGLKPAIVGAMHGLAGSAALTLLVLTQIQSPLLGLIYLGVFGIGSMVGMLLMSGLVGLPFVISSRKLNGVHYGLQMLAGSVSIVFGVWYAYETGFASGLMKSLTRL